MTTILGAALVATAAWAGFATRQWMLWRDRQRELARIIAASGRRGVPPRDFIELEDETGAKLRIDLP